jgi:hypothetical protein
MGDYRARSADHPDALTSRHNLAGAYWAAARTTEAIALYECALAGMEQAGLTEEQVAAHADVAVATVRKIETGAVIEPGYSTVLALARAIGAGPGDLPG